VGAPAEEIDVLGVGITVTTPARTIETIAGWLAEGRREYVCLTPVSGVMEAVRDPDVFAALERAGITAPDGMPLVWCGWAVGASEMNRVYGPDLMPEICAQAVPNGWRSYLYGAGPGVADLVRRRLCAQFPGLQVVGAETPPYRPLTEDEKNALAARIDASGADLVWIGVSTPKQELWMADMIDRIRRPVVLLAVGAAFDIHAGLQPHPPGWMGPLGLFWLYRLMREPRRLAGRYLRDIPAFLWGIARRRPFLRPVAGSGADDGSAVNGRAHPAAELVDAVGARDDVRLVGDQQRGG
jgi:N-acetylglucosaminyldiphosphoundecaprenol N-acetyl-beta-D-mannosaminyltransferase